MKLKTYRAESMAAALAAVKRELGSDAVILHTRAYKAGALLGFGGKGVVEITASNDRGILASRADAKNRRGNGLDGVAAVPKVNNTAGAAGGVGAVAIAKARTQGAVAPSVAKPATEECADAAVRQELAAIRRMVSTVVAGQHGAGLGIGHSPASESLLVQYSKLIENEVARELAGELVAGLSAELTALQLADDGVVRRAVLGKLEGLFPSADAVLPAGRQADGRPLTLAIIGPTGVGKTTTIAKLAAIYGLRQGLKVGMVTTDTYRIAAVDQLRTYAGVMGIPLLVAQTGAEAKAATRRLADCDVILIDTAGRSPADTARLEQLGDVLGLVDPHETHLALCTTSARTSLVRTIETFAPLRPNRIILTKLDEASSIGVLLGVLRHAARALGGVSLSFLTTGQEVPADIEAFSPGRLAGLMLDGMKSDPLVSVGLTASSL